MLKLVDKVPSEIHLFFLNIVEDSYIMTISGDVKIGMNNRQADKELKIKTTSGDIRVG